MCVCSLQVCSSFYRELRNPHFPNRYADYLKRGGFTDAKKALELTGILRNGMRKQRAIKPSRDHLTRSHVFDPLSCWCAGVVAPEFIAHPEMPSAPLRAFSYTMAGGASSCGQRPNAVFKCPDGYAGSYPERLPPQGGYHDFRNPACNPFSNKIVLMDEVSLTRLHTARLSL